VLLVFVTIGLLFLKRKAVNKCNFPPFQAQDFKAKQPHSALHFSDNISQNIPTWLFFFFFFFRKDCKCLILFRWHFPWLFNLLFRRSSFGTLRISLNSSVRSSSSLEVEGMLLLASVPHYHLSSRPTRNLVVKITHSLYSELKLRAAIGGGRFWIEKTLSRSI
jgi:hypothetical protein